MLVQSVSVFLSCKYRNSFLSNSSLYYFRDLPMENSKNPLNFIVSKTLGFPLVNNHVTTPILQYLLNHLPNELAIFVIERYSNSRRLCINL